MKFITERSTITGEAKIPGSKSHTVRAVFAGTLANGESKISNPLASWDCLSAVEVCRLLGAKIEISDAKWIIEGTGGGLKIPDDVLNAGNSGTTMYITLGVTSLLEEGYSVLTGDSQLRERPVEPLVNALNELGATIISTKRNMLLPLVIKGRLKGGRTSLPGVNSQWLTGLLMAAPLSDGDVEVHVDNLQETPYVDMTLSWLDRCGIEYEKEGYEQFNISKSQEYHSFDASIPGDWESASFILGAAAIFGEDVTVYGLDTTDSQGDKAIIDLLKEMGASVEVRDYGKGGVRVQGGNVLHGVEVDCANLPDIPPILAVLGTQAEGETVLYNLEASHLKETDRPKSISMELAKMGANVEYDGKVLKVRKSNLRGTRVSGHHDHRIVMAASIAGMTAEGVTLIEDAEYTAVSFPNFYDVFKSLGANIEKVP